MDIKTDYSIHIPGRNRPTITDNRGGVIRISTEAYNALVDIYNESSLSLKDVASRLIIGAAAHVVYDREEE